MAPPASTSTSTHTTGRSSNNGSNHNNNNDNRTSKKSRKRLISNATSVEDAILLMTASRRGCHKEAKPTPHVVPLQTHPLVIATYPHPQDTTTTTTTTTTMTKLPLKIDDSSLGKPMVVEFQPPHKQPPAALAPNVFYHEQPQSQFASFSSLGSPPTAATEPMFPSTAPATLWDSRVTLAASMVPLVGGGIAGVSPAMLQEYIASANGSNNIILSPPIVLQPPPGLPPVILWNAQNPFSPWTAGTKAPPSSIGATSSYLDMNNALVSKGLLPNMTNNNNVCISSNAPSIPCRARSHDVVSPGYFPWASIQCQPTLPRAVAACSPSLFMSAPPPPPPPPPLSFTLQPNDLWLVHNNAFQFVASPPSNVATTLGASDIQWLCGASMMLTNFLAAPPTTSSYTPAIERPQSSTQWTNNNDVATFDSTANSCVPFREVTAPISALPSSSSSSVPRDTNAMLFSRDKNRSGFASLALAERGPDLNLVVSIESLPKCLYVPTDDKVLTAHQVFLRQQIEVFVATESDVNTKSTGRNKRIHAGQVGLRCRHCSHLSHIQIASIYFPAKIMGIYQAAQNMSACHLQNGTCSEMPDAVKDRFVELMGSKLSGSRAGRKYWEKNAKKLGLVDTDVGISFSPFHNSV